MLPSCGRVASFFVAGVHCFYSQQSSSHYKFFSACDLVKCCYIGACVKCDPTAVSVSRERENKSKVSEARIGIELSEGNKCVERSISEEKASASAKQQA